MKRAVLTAGAPTPGGPYSQAIVAGGFVFLAGQRPQHPETGQVPDGVQAQTEQVLRNIAAVLDAAGCGLGDVVKVTAHLADIGDFEAFNSVYRKYFTEPYPARTTVASTLRGISVEIDVIATVPTTR